MTTHLHRYRWSLLTTCCYPALVAYTAAQRYRVDLNEPEGDTE